MRKLLHRVRARAGFGRASPGTAEPAPDLPAPDAPVAIFADVLDGGLLLVCYQPAPGRLAFRAGEGGQVIQVPAEHGRMEHDLMSARASLPDVEELPVGEDWTYDVVLVDDAGADHHLWLPPPGVPTASPPVGDRQFRIGRGPAGYLKVHHRPVPAGVDLLGFAGTEDAVELRLPPDVTGELLLCDDDHVFTALPLRRENGECRVTLTADVLPAETFAMARVRVGTPQKSRPVRRRQNGLVDPGDAVVLPDLFGDDPDVPVTRLRFTRDAELIMQAAESTIAAVGDPE